MTRRPLAVVLALALGAGGAAAQQGEGTRPAGKETEVRRFLEASGRADLGPALLEPMIAQLREQPGLPDGFMSAFREAADPDAFVERLVPIYSDLDAATLDAAIAFYETPAGRRLAAAQARLDAAVQQAAGEWAQEAAYAAMEAVGMPTPEESLREARRHGNEAAAIGALRTISTAQSLFREADKDANQVFDYAGSLAALGEVDLIDEVLASGEKQGYRFELCAGSEAPEFLWMAVASPIEPGETGERHLVINQMGVIFYSTEAPFALDRETCEIPEGATPVGK